MIVTVDPDAGFCYGVERTIEIAEQELAKDGTLFCLGQIVHNEEEEQRLKNLGLVVIDHEQFKKLQHSKVLIRAHGEPPETYKIAAANNIQLVDASCPIVLAIQKKIRRTSEKTSEKNGQIVIYGRKNHPEVIGLAGQAGNHAIVVEDENDLGKIDFTKPVNLFAQTTKSPENYQKLIAKISTRLDENQMYPKSLFVPENTICRHVSGRDKNLKKFAAANDIVIFVGGLNSSNGKFLSGVCREVNHKTRYIQSADMLQPGWFLGAKTTGVTGATSTPRWLLEDVAGRIKQITLQS